VPPCLPTQALQTLTAALHTHLIHAQTLEHPTAAAAYWVHHHQHRLTAWADQHPNRALHLFVLHTGLTQWHACTMSLNIVDGRVRISPELDLAETQPPAGYGLDLLSRLAAGSLEMSYRQASPGRIWQLMWCTPWMQWALDRLSDRESPCRAHWVGLSAHAMSTRFLKQQCRQATRQILTGGPHAVPVILRDIRPSPSLENLRDWLNRMRQALKHQPLDGAIITGAMAGIVHDQGITQGEYLLRRILPELDQVLVEARDAPPGAAAQGAAAITPLDHPLHEHRLVHQDMIRQPPVDRRGGLGGA